MSAALSFVLAWVGMLLLTGVFFALRRILRLERCADRAWNDVDQALVSRNERAEVFNRAVRRIGGGGGGGVTIGPISDNLDRALKAVAAAADERGARIRAEQEAARCVAVLLADPYVARAPEPVPALCGEMRERERQIADARERYNEAALAVNGSRRSLPTGIVARALRAGDLPLFTTPGA